MKFITRYKISNFFLILFTLCLLFFLSPFFASAQDAVPAVEKYSAEEIEELVAPIALYPDDLLAQVLTASTVPLDVVRAARYQEQHKGASQPSQKEMEIWEPAVVSLMMFPDTLKMMYDNLDWTEQLGAVMYSQEEDVYDAVQQLRRRADAVGHLDSNEKQVIIKEKEIIKIVPANPEVIYVPVYDPAVIYVPSSTVVISRPHPWITFGVGVTVGIGLSYAFNWHHRHVVHHHHWGRPGHHNRYYYKKRPPSYPGRPPGTWRPPRPSHKPGYRPGKPNRPPLAGSKPPGYKPGKPNRPAVGKPSGQKPGKPNRPTVGKPSGQKPGKVTRPAPSKKPAVKPAQRPAVKTKPSARPSKPVQRPAVKTRPSARPSKPANSAVRGYKRGSETRKSSSRGRQSRMGQKAPSRQTPAAARPADRGNKGRAGSGQGNRMRK